jgi:hypothetical protein
MTTKLDKPIRREIEIDGEPFTAVITPQGIRLTRKRFRSGKIVSWKTILEGTRTGAVDPGRSGAHAG